MHFGSFQNLVIDPLLDRHPKSSSLKFSALHSDGNINRYFRQLSPIQQKKFSALYPQPSFVHAEVQLLMHLESKAGMDSGSRVFDYLGCSKRTCFLCCHFIAEYKAFRTRGIHGKVYPMWTVPKAQYLRPSAVTKLQTAVVNLEDRMVLRLNSSPNQLKRSPTAESTLDTQLPPSNLRQERLASERIKHVAQESSCKKSSVTKLGKRRDTIRAVRIPADDKASPHLVTLTTYETSKDYDAQDSYCFNVPDFSSFWGNEYNFERRCWEFDAKNQVPACVNGLYRAYWNRNDDLPENEFLRRTIVKGDIASYHQFFYGDVFIVKQYTEGEFEYDKNGYQLYSDIPPEILDTHFIQTLFGHLWKENVRGKILEREVEAEDFNAKLERDKALVLARMSPMQREVLSYCPPGMLDMLAITQCDEDALRDCSITTAKPEFVSVNTMFTGETLERMGWEEFSSDQL
ncbi:MAG: hypothetical protein M1812_001943 [Candelaria pacifica]|nr:MAG: hypothetical protein M1812_001943 [Candelaria pacifica]